MSTEREILNGARLLRRNLRRANMLRAAARARVEKGILIREIVEAAFRNNFENWQR